jgi:hypothetical protein
MAQRVKDFFELLIIICNEFSVLGNPDFCYRQKYPQEAFPKSFSAWIQKLEILEMEGKEKKIAQVFCSLEDKKVPLCFSFFFSQRNFLDILQKHKNFKPHLAWKKFNKMPNFYSVVFRQNRNLLFLVILSTVVTTKICFFNKIS